MSANKKRGNLKETLARLEQIIQELNDKDLDVESGLAKFKEGAELIKLSHSKFKQAENEFQKIKAELEKIGDLETAGEELSKAARPEPKNKTGSDAEELPF